MQPGTHRKAGTATLCTVALLLTTAAPSYCGAVTDSFQSIAEQAWMQQYIPRSDEETLPLTDYDDFEVTELFRAETIEDLEASLTDGYPMPWLERVLKDESIPWEDRYWLDCRVRSIFAQDLHLFFDREGNPVQIEAEWIAPGEDYWRENMLVRPVVPGEHSDNQEDTIDQDGRLNLAYYESNPGENIREPFNENSPTLMSDPPGKILNLFGEQVGRLAVVNRSVVLSRDASVGAVQSGGNGRIDNWDRTAYACILYPDGSFVEKPFEQTGQYRAAVSADGSVVAFICIHIVYPEYDNQIVDAFVFDRNGNLINRITPPDPFYGTYLPQISPDGELCPYTMLSGDISICKLHTGEIQEIIEPITNTNQQNGRLSSNTLKFSADSHYLCLGGFSAGMIIDVATNNAVWVGNIPESEYTFTIVRCSNSADRIVTTTRCGTHGNFSYEQRIYENDIMVYEDTSPYSWMSEKVMSPGGSFLLGKSEDIHIIGDSSLPVMVQMISGGR
jgi:hypothetical protein